MSSDDEVVDAILARAQQQCDRHTLEADTELQEFCKSVNDALDVYSVKGVDVNLILASGVPEDIDGFKQKCRTILENLRKATSPDTAVREARIALSGLTNEVLDEVAGRLNFSSQPGVWLEAEGQFLDLDFFQEGFVVRDARGDSSAAALVVESIDQQIQPFISNWSSLAPSEREEIELPKIPQLESLRPYHIGEHRSVLEDIKKGILPTKFRRRDKRDQPVPTTFTVHDLRPRNYAPLRKSIDDLKQIQVQQKREREEIEERRREAKRREEEEAERKRRQEQEEAERKQRQEFGVGRAVPAKIDEPMASKGEGSVTVDTSKPTTKIQIRFHDGSKKAQEFNQDQTVGDLRNFCSQVTGQAMAIKGGFPPKPITDDAQTLKDAGLCGAAVTVQPA